VAHPLAEQSTTKIPKPPENVFRINNRSESRLYGVVSPGGSSGPRALFGCSTVRRVLPLAVFTKQPQICRRGVTFMAGDAPRGPPPGTSITCLLTISVQFRELPDIRESDTSGNPI